MLRIVEVQVLLEVDGDQWQGVGYWRAESAILARFPEGWFVSVLAAFTGSLRHAGCKWHDNSTVVLLSLSVESLILDGPARKNYEKRLDHYPVESTKRCGWEVVRPWLLADFEEGGRSHGETER
jgi:hypothetical protein